MSKQLKLIAICSLALVIFLGLAGWYVYWLGVTHERDAWTVKVAKAEAAQKEKVLTIERQAASNLATKQKELNDEKQKTVLAVSGANSELDGLRQTITNLKRKLPTTTSGTSPTNEALARSWDALESCSKEYTTVAKVADEQRDELAEWQAYGQVIDDFRYSINH